MKVVLNCCTKPAMYSNKSGITLFRGEKPEAAAQSQVKPKEQLAADTLVISTKAPAEKTEAAKAATEADVKSDVKAEVKADLKPEAVASK